VAHSFFDIHLRAVGLLRPPVTSSLYLVAAIFALPPMTSIVLCFVYKLVEHSDVIAILGPLKGTGKELSKRGCSDVDIGQSRLVDEVH